MNLLPDIRQDSIPSQWLLKIYNVTFYITEEKFQTPNYPDSLQQVALTLLDPETCRDQVDGYRYGVVVTDKMICAGRDVNGYGVCEVSDVVFRNFTGNPGFLW